MMEDLLQSSPSLFNFSIFFIQAVVFLLITLAFVCYGILAERKVMGYMQLRHGPKFLGGKWGLLQTIADVLKLLLKEDIMPRAIDKPLFIIAPVMAFAPSFMVLATIPFTDKFQFADIGIGVLYYVAVSGLTIVGIVTGGWASNNKYALLGAMRAAAQMISYEIPLVMSVIGVILLSGSLNLNDIVETQKHGWFILLQPIGFIVFFISSFAELNRSPFDLSEAESELIAGYHIEYSGFRWAFFMLAEYVYLFAMSSLITVVFLGGWLPPLHALSFIPGSIWFPLKFVVVIFVYIWCRTTFPRMRADQLMEFGWKVLLPISLANIFLTALIKTLFF
ncbi:NADH-quinone oxidoreductase subunit NuoH [Neobacillus sp. PS3-40]|jgi:NADH-quinone oxidoreductase subunit H|uniref:NADH-quinone oxidoreductase subunit NuoH n=1 Tax=Neobacillus sp. PS3-40 TaxID=3070679 RepID=UPI0027DED6F3|nr:NADH-quinone oxidoreductase subunit NuoH [Neobacillus sp. PS3-40]WML46231.1 NADH-quinone oxidoreductase subunit NuoH [Neobacillus sp. PS3-40]